MLSDISNIVLDNKYTKWYYNIIDRATTRVDQTLSISEQKKFITQQLTIAGGTWRFELECRETLQANTTWARDTCWIRGWRRT